MGVQGYLVVLTGISSLGKKMLNTFVPICYLYLLFSEMSSHLLSISDLIVFTAKFGEFFLHVAVSPCWNMWFADIFSQFIAYFLILLIRTLLERKF
jgi:hypothetical protein